MVYTRHCSVYMYSAQGQVGNNKVVNIHLTKHMVWTPFKQTASLLFIDHYVEKQSFSCIQFTFTISIHSQHNTTQIFQIWTLELGEEVAFFIYIFFFYLSRSLFFLNILIFFYLKWTHSWMWKLQQRNKISIQIEIKADSANRQRKNDRQKRKKEGISKQRNR